MDILIVEGNPPAVLAAARAAGRRQGHETYRAALALHAPEARFTTLFALAPESGRSAVDPAAFDGIALAGSGVPWSAGQPEARPYLDLLERLLAAGRPVIGSCWGLQAAAVVLGGRVEANPNGSEIGVARDIALTPAGRAHWGFAGMPDRFDQPTLHRDHVAMLPPGAVHLARNAVCEVQAFAYREGGIDFLGLQPHPEFDLDHIRAIVASRPPLPGTIRELADFPDRPSPHVGDPLERTRVLGNWLAHVRRASERPDALVAAR
ncbi:MAG: hypothetical protein BroJett030_07900 [Alphaproteobacteria bacterium]|nr:MAG: hypothetical protein BroJett030_07900 [Alphaproteobacteria bacterium]